MNSADPSASTNDDSRQQRPRLDALLARIDVDKDGSISKTELENISAILRSLDKNGDGTVSRDESNE